MIDKRIQITCSFCGKSEAEGRVAWGPKASICEDCVRLGEYIREAADVIKTDQDEGDSSPVMNVLEVCDLLRIHKSTLYRLLRRRKIPAFRIASEYRFNREDIYKWMNEQQLKKFSSN